MKDLFSKEDLMMMLKERIAELAEVLKVPETHTAKITGMSYDSWLYEIVEKTVRRKTTAKAGEFRKEQYIQAIRVLDNRRFKLQGLEHLVN